MSKKIFSKHTQLLNVQQAAEFLEVNPGTIRRWAQLKTMNGLKVGIRGDWRFTKEDLLKMAKTNVSDIQETFEQTQLYSAPVEHTVINADEQLGKGMLVPRLDWIELGGSEHFVQFYENDTFLLDSLSMFIGMGLSENDTCIVVATKMHRESLEERLRTYGLDLIAKHVSGQFILLDSVDILSQFMVDQIPDPDKFYTAFENIIKLSGQNGRRLRIFGEMVAFLWAEGNQTGAIQLEKLWNELQKKISFSLFCAYPLDGFDEEGHGTPFSQIGTHHTSVIPTESYTALTSSDEKLREIAVLQQKARSLENEIEKRKKLERQKDEFMGIVSHELKTPVTSLKAFAQVLQKKFEKEGDMQAASYLAKMDTQVNKLTVLIEDLLDVTKIQEGKLRFQEDFFDLDSLVTEIIEELQRTTEKHHIIKKGRMKIGMYGDKDRIGQVITNLLTNAMKYSPDANKVIIAMRTHMKDVQISIQDFGIGIAKDEQEHIFERFYRESSVTQETFPGLGLGLYISNEIIKRHGGRIWVESTKGNGSTFSFTLPLTNEQK